MNGLYELIDLFPSKFIPCFSEQLNKLFVFLQKNKRLTEEEAAVLFFNCEGKDKYFNKLKHKLRAQLVNQLLVNPAVWTDTRQKELVDEFYKNFATYKILTASGRAQNGFELAKKLLPVALNFETHSLVFEIASDLQYYYSGMKISPGRSKKYGRIAKNSLEVINAELIIRRHHSDITLIANTKNSFSPAAIEQLKDAVREVKPFLKLESGRLGHLIYNIIITAAYADYRYENILERCREALNYFSTEHLNYNAFRFSILQKKIPALIAMSRFEDAKEIAKEACQMMPAGKFNWHLIYIRRLIINFHAGSYQEAYDLYKTQVKYGCGYQILNEYWNILRGYLFMLIRLGKIEPYSEERFNLGRFLNEVPLYSRDKAGSNINILLLQIMIQLQRGQFGKIIDYVDSLKVYARKYTRNPETIRANIFINMIIKAEASSFHRAATERKTQKLYLKLKNTPIRLGQNISIEIIPYEVLWEEVLNMLENKFRGSTISKQNVYKR